MVFKRIYLALVVTVLFAVAPFLHAQTTTPAEASTPQFTIFERDDCTHCQDLKAFLDTNPFGDNQLDIVRVDIKTEQGEKVFQNFTSTFELSQVTPIMVVNDSILVGFQTPETTGKKLVELVQEKQGRTVSVQDLLHSKNVASTEQDDKGVCEEECVYEPTVEVADIEIPFIGTIDAKQYSLGILALLLGFVDGFNPCAMWVLVMFLTLLLQAGSRKRMFQMAGLFILAETIMYYLILTVWITAWDFIGLDAIVTPIVGVIAVAAGIFFLYEFKKFKGQCKLVGGEQKKKIHNRIARIINNPMNLVGILGILGIAFSVNIIEFACSIGIPQAFTKILDINGLNFWQIQGYTGLYVLMYMVDDLIVFAGALYAFDKLNLTTKYAQFSNLIGGILMIALGILLLFFPDLLVL